MKRFSFLATAVALCLLAPGAALADNFCPQVAPLGTPELPSNPYGGSLRVICRPGYAVLHSSATKTPLVVAERLSGANVGGSEPRYAKFMPEPTLPARERSDRSDYARSGCDQGHMAPAADFAYDADRMRESFYLSNIVPQDPNNNQHIWRDLETRARQWAKSRGELLIYTGPIFEQAAPKSTLDRLKDVAASLLPSSVEGHAAKPKRNAADFSGPGSCSTQASIGEGVRVPQALFKVVYDPRTNGAIAFVIPNKPADPATLRDWIVPVAEVERLTGLAFLPQLAPKLAAEAKSKRSGMWSR